MGVFDAMMYGRAPVERQVGELWELELACQDAAEGHWATGKPAWRSRRARRAAGLDSEVGAVAGRLGRRAGDLCGTRPWWKPERPAPSLNELADMPETDAVVAAAALRVFDGRAHLEDSESLQSGGELSPEGDPAWAGLRAGRRGAR